MKGLRAKTEVWCHTCWGNPSQQRMFKDVMSYKPALEVLDKVDADVITFESVSAGGADLEAFGKVISPTRRSASASSTIIRCRSSGRTRSPTTSAARSNTSRPSGWCISSDCGMGREGMSRRHAYYKIVALVLGTNMVRKELGLPEAECWPPTRAIRWWCRAPEVAFLARDLFRKPVPSPIKSGRLRDHAQQR